MQRAGAAERDEREVARIEPLLDRDDAQRAHHLRVHDVDHPGWVDGSQRPLGGLRVELDPARQGRRQAPEEKIRVGHRRPGTTPPVAGGAGIGARALRADAQRPAFVEPDDRAAACADGMHGQGRQTDRQAVDEALVLAPRLTVDDRAHIRRRAAHVERERVLEACERREPGRADDPGSGPGEKRERSVRGRLLERREAARGAHHERCRKPCIGTRSPERAEVVREDGAEVRVHSGRRRALVLAELRRDLVRRDDVRGRIATPQLLGDTTLGLGVAEREEERDGDRLRVDLRERVEVERDELAVRAGSSAHADAALERNEWRRVVDARAVEVRAGLSAQVEDVLEALVRHERRARAAPLEERVRRDRGAVREALDVRGAHGGGGADDGVLLPRGRRHLRDADLTVLEQHGIGERPTDVDPERAHVQHSRARTE